MQKQVQTAGADVNKQSTERVDYLVPLIHVQNTKTGQIKHYALIFLDVDDQKKNIDLLVAAQEAKQ